MFSEVRWNTTVAVKYMYQGTYSMHSNSALDVAVQNARLLDAENLCAIRVRPCVLCTPVLRFDGRSKCCRAVWFLVLLVFCVGADMAYVHVCGMSESYSACVPEFVRSKEWIACKLTGHRWQCYMYAAGTVGK